MKNCKYCGEKIKDIAVKCRYCNSDLIDKKIETKKSKNVAGVLALLLGGLGVHRFYMGKPISGIFYILFFWTWIPAIIGFIEGLVYLLNSQEKFNELIK